MFVALQGRALTSLSAALRYRHPLARFSVESNHGCRRLAQGRTGQMDSSASDTVVRHARDERLARVEAVLWLAGEALSAHKIGQFASLADATEARTLIRRLNQLYDEGGTAFRAEEVAGGYQLLSRRKFGGWLRRLGRGPSEVRLSSPALEILSIVALRQPVSRGEIEMIRGVHSGEMLRQLMERDLVKMVGRGQQLGRPFLYGTTKRFLQLFGLKDHSELPAALGMQADHSATGPTYEPDNSSGSGQQNLGTSFRAFHEEPSVSIAPAQTLDTEHEWVEELAVAASRHLSAVDEEEDEDIEDADADEEEDDEEEEDEEDEDFDDDFDDEDWEEVDDEDEEWDEDEEDDEEWDEDEDEDDDEEEEWEEGDAE
ncbi:MAG TPA: SMC-Scp complex subunit ScpB [Pirellulales bacterium]|jgi:segregation and condensation protein B|nr:SMC-Scp complex subunit ScpB [Pirellulales bacterium]